MPAQLDESQVPLIPIIPIEDEEEGVGDDYTLGIYFIFTFFNVGATSKRMKHEMIVLDVYLVLSTLSLS